jgi:hypothetical protein
LTMIKIPGLFFLRQFADLVAVASVVRGIY